MRKTITLLILFVLALSTLAFYLGYNASEREIILEKKSLGFPLTQVEVKEISKNKASYITWENSDKKYKIKINEKFIEGNKFKTSLLFDGDFKIHIGEKHLINLHINSLKFNNCKEEDVSLICTSALARRMISESDENIKKALELLSIRIKNDYNYEYICHDTAHVIGIYSLMREKKLSEAAKFSDPICDNGFIHGLSEFYSQVEVDSDDNSKLYSELCQNINGNKSSCFHGLGHGAFYKYANLDEALSRCEDVSGKDNYYFTNKELCAGGVSMSFSNNPMVTKDNSGGGLLICKSQRNEEIKNGCYMYILGYLSRNLDNLRKIPEICNREAKSYYCFYGLGFQSGYGNKYDLKVGGELCQEAESQKDFEICYLNLIGQKLGYKDEFGNLKAISCKILRDKNKYFCREINDLIDGKVANPT